MLVGLSLVEFFCLNLLTRSLLLIPGKLISLVGFALTFTLSYLSEV
jgi:hypothetical protein